ncbi:MAG: hypothetical protein M1834_007904 [Cirrosporium novae-zelandiae]|nr:MAG: hypothetical protein M1834_007904 [Cirrosporium novae-zelandiae]
MTPGEITYTVLLSIGGTYVVFLAALLHPNVQRFAVYANKFHTAGWWHNLNDPESFGFSRNQVQPFTLQTHDNATLYAWHILPLTTYEKQSTILRNSPVTKSPLTKAEFTQSAHFNFLKDDPDAKVVIIHGNAGHLAQTHRHPTFRLLSTLPNTHILTLDYRSYGLSHPSPQPTEAGLITDGTAFLNFVLYDMGVNPKNVVILGQSLGTAVATAVCEKYLLGGQNDIGGVDGNIERVLENGESGIDGDITTTTASMRPTDPTLIPVTPDEQTPLIAPSPPAINTSHSHPHSRPIPPASLILVAPFITMPSLLPAYSILHLIPILSPLRIFPSVQKYILNHFVCDHWDTLGRLQRMVGEFGVENVGGGREREREIAAVVEGSKLDVQILHARDDWDIPVLQGVGLFEGIVASQIERSGTTRDVVWRNGDGVGGSSSSRRSKAKEARVEVFEIPERAVRVRLEIVRFGAHNDVMMYSPVMLAVMRGFGV